MKKHWSAYLEKCKVKLHWDVILHLSNWWKLKRMTTHSVGKAVGRQAPSSLPVGVQTGTSLWRGVWQLWIQLHMYSPCGLDSTSRDWPWRYASKIQKHACTRSFRAALFVTGRNHWQMPELVLEGMLIYSWKVLKSLPRRYLLITKGKIATFQYRNLALLNQMFRVLITDNKTFWPTWLCTKGTHIREPQTEEEATK